MANRTVSVRLMADIGQYVSGMSTAAAATSRLGNSVTESTSRTQSGFSIASKGAVLMGAAVVGGMALAVSKSMEFEKAMSGAAAATQVTGGALQDLRDAAMEAGAATQYSATEAAQAITEMGKAGVATADILGGGLDGALSLAAAGQLEVAKAAEIASVAMTQFKLTGDQLPHVADLLAAGAGKAMGSVEDLGMALNQAGLVASASGLNIEETTGVLAAFASAGLVGSDAGTSLKTMLQKLQNPSKEAAGLMADLGINMYDANGNFAGMDSLAGQLKGSMATLTPAVRDAAMATIFGSDAVRAANVLYSQGAEGIQDWTKKVNDAGYAAEQAAALNDNLAGDLEKLGGAFDTLMISIGSGAQGPLRSLVQGFTSLLDGLGELGGPLKATAGFLADNIEAVIALAAALAIQLVGGIGAASAAMGAFLGPRLVMAAVGLLQPFVALSNFLSLGFVGAVTAARTALMGFLTAVAPLAAVAAVTYMTMSILNSGKAAEDARDEIAAMWETVDKAEGSAKFDALTENINTLRDHMSDLKVEMEALGVTDLEFGASDAFKNFFNFNAKQEASDAIATYKLYTDALEKARDTQVEATRTANTLGNQFGLNRQQVLDLADKYDIDLTQGAQNAYLQFQRFYTTEYGKGPDNSTRQLIGSLEVMADKTSTAEERIDALKTALDLLGGKQVSVFEATSALQQVVDSAAGALEGLSGEVLTADGHLNAYSESGRAAGDVLVGVRDKGNDLIATMISQGSTLEEVTAKDAELRASFLASADAMGIGEDAAKLLADEILGVPEERRTRFEAQIDPAMAELQRLQLRMDEVARNRSATITIRATMPDLNGAVSGSGRLGTFGAIGGIVHAYASGGFERLTPMQGGIAQMVKPNTFRVIGDRVRDDEAYIPINNDARSHEILRQTNERMGYGMGREFSGMSFGGGGSSSVDNSRSTRIEVIAPPNQRAIANAIAERQRDLEFLHG